MSDSIVLVAAVLASLATGVLIAYGVCLGMFRLFQMGVIRAELPVEAKSERLVSGPAPII